MDSAAIISLFEDTIMEDPDAYTRVGECTYQVTQKELLEFAQALIKKSKEQ